MAIANLVYIYMKITGPSKISLLIYWVGIPQPTQIKSTIYDCEAYGNHSQNVFFVSYSLKEKL